MNRLLFFISLFLFSGCSCSKKAADSTNHRQNDEQTIQQPSSKSDSAPRGSSTNPSESANDTSTSKPVSETIYRFIVSFYSIGSGTEGAQIEKLDKFLLEYRQKSNKIIPSEKTFWGREGEVDYCISLSELTSKEQLKFIEELKEELKAAKWVHFTENSTCKKKRR